MEIKEAINILKEMEHRHIELSEKAESKGRDHNADYHFYVAMGIKDAKQVLAKDLDLQEAIELTERRNQNG